MKINLAIIGTGYGLRVVKSTLGFLKYKNQKNL